MRSLREYALLGDLVFYATFERIWSSARFVFVRPVVNVSDS